MEWKVEYIDMKRQGWNRDGETKQEKKADKRNKGGNMLRDNY